jgi:hypothetical protein
VSLRDPTVVNLTLLAGCARAFARPTPGSIHIILGPVAPAWFAELKDS